MAAPKRSCSAPLSTEEPSSLSIVETSSSSQITEFGIQTSRIHINEKKSKNENKESISVKCQPGPDYSFPMNNLERKSAVFKPLGSRTFPGYTIPKKTHFYVSFA